MADELTPDEHERRDIGGVVRAEPTEVEPGDGRPDQTRPDDERRGFDLQARIFCGIGAFLVVVAAGYGVVSHEYAGTTMLALASGLVLTIGGYVGWQRPVPGHPLDAVTGEPEDDQPWFPTASGWPFALALGIVLVANGLLLGLWLLLPAAAFLGFAVGGFVRQSRLRS